MVNIIAAVIIVFIINLPFGLWRANVKKFSLEWFLAVHLPVPLVILARILTDIGFGWYTYIFLVAAFFLGQWTGGRIAGIKKSKK